MLQYAELKDFLGSVFMVSFVPFVVSQQWLFELLTSGHPLWVRLQQVVGRPCFGRLPGGGTMAHGFRDLSSLYSVRDALFW